MVILLLLGFFLSSSLSLIWAQNVEAFISIYKDFVIGIMSFFVFHYFAHEKQKIVIALIVTMPLSILYQIVLLYGNPFVEFLSTVIYQRHFHLVQFNLERNRLYLDVYDEAFVPMLILLMSEGRKATTVTGGVLLFCLSCLSFLSNFRTRIIMLILGFLASTIFLYKITVKRFVFVLGCIILISLFMSYISLSTLGYTFSDRFLLSDEEQDIDTIFSRYNQIIYGLEMGLKSPFGVGMGNYYDNLVGGKSPYHAFQYGQYVNNAKQSIHNNLVTIIAESGYIAFGFYVLLLAIFAKKDYIIMKQNDRYKKAFVISFWLLFIFGLLNPPIPASYQVLFWGIRGVLA